MGKGSSQNTMTMGPTYGGPPGPPVNYNSLNYGGGSGLMRPTPTGSGKGGMAPAGGGGGFMGGSFGSPPQFQPTGKGGGIQTQGDLGTNMTPPPPTGLFPPPTATTAMPGLPDNFGQPGGPAYRPTGTEGNRVQPEDYAMNPAVRQPAVPEYLRPYITDIADRRPRPPQGVAVPRPVAGGAPRPRPQPEFTSEMFGTTMARTPTEMAMLNKRQQELDAAAAQQADFDARQKEYDEMFGGLTEEQQAFFGDQLQSPQAQLDRQYNNFLQNQLRPNRLNQLNFLSSILRDRLPSRTPSRPVFDPRENEGYRGPTVAMQNAFGGTGTDMQRGTTSSNRLGQLFGLSSAFRGNPFSR